MKERADSEFRIALERLFQRVGAECEKASFLCVQVSAEERSWREGA